MQPASTAYIIAKVVIKGNYWSTEVTDHQVNVFDAVRMLLYQFGMSKAHLHYYRRGSAFPLLLTY